MNRRLPILPLIAIISITVGCSINLAVGDRTATSPTLAPPIGPKPEGQPINLAQLHGRIVFVSFRGVADACATKPYCPNSLFSMDADGSHIRQLRAPPGAKYGPQLSPDGRSIAYSADPDGFSMPSIVIMNATGGDSTIIPKPVDVAEQGPRWSPDGETLLMERSGTLDAQYSVASALWTFDLQTGASRQLVGAPGTRNNHASWSPNGTIAWDHGVLTDDASSIETMPVTGGTLSTLLPAAFLTQLAWSPDGSELAFAVGVDGNADICLMASDGTNVRRLTDDPAFDSAPSWSPDGRFIVFESLRDGDAWHAALYVMRADGTGETRLTGAYGDTDPNWGPAAH